MINFFNTIPNDTIVLEKNTHLFLVGLLKKGWKGQRHLVIDARAKGASCECVFFILGKDQNSFQAKIEAIHRAPHTSIKARVRAVLTGRSKADIEGIWKVEKVAVGADTYFSHHTLLLSDKASAKTAPYLEIKTDEVKAGHAASVGKVDEDALFYLLSRGLSENEARTLLVEGFFENDLSSITDEKIKDSIRKSIVLFLSQIKNEK